MKTKPKKNFYKVKRESKSTLLNYPYLDLGFVSQQKKRTFDSTIGFKIELRRDKCVRKVFFPLESSDHNAVQPQ